MHEFRKLAVWRRSMDLAEQIYRISGNLPVDERYGMASQMKRCSVSVPSNIAEGAGRGTRRQFRYFLEIAMGSCNELQTQLELAFRFNYIEEQVLIAVGEDIIQVYKMISAFYRSLSAED